MADELTIPSPVDTLIDVVNRHEADRFLDLFTEDGFVDDWGRTFTGRDAIAAWSEREFIGSDGTLTPRQVTVDDGNGEVTVIGDWRSNHANGLSRFTFGTRGDHIASMTIREGRNP
ncbi:nuclear transport factor 2 family protein [Nocardia grenadensis]|uniref:nuclear transport factor 2 family protein n=1 Tax=Nocardia grenadensis TaxID=931537 RepID=UPI0007A42475|nr:nuclear transport factor 2 family protein [Nocardia grenadensis]